MSIWSPTNYPSTLWLIKWAIILVVAMQTILLFLRNERLNMIMTRLTRRLPISGNLVLMTAMRAAYTWVKLGEAIWALIIALVSKPIPLWIFSLNSSITMFWILEMLTLLTIPLILFLKSYHIMRWWSTLFGSYYMIFCCIARSLWGGTYAPPALAGAFSFLFYSL